MRRGELLVALEHFDAYLAQQPDDERIRTRMEAVRALLQPSELVSRRRAEPEEADPKAEPASFNDCRTTRRWNFGRLRSRRITLTVTKPAIVSNDLLRRSCRML